MKSDPSTRTIVISGGGRGIGRAVGLLCAERGDNVILLDRHVGPALEAAEAMLARGASGAIGLTCDVSDEAQVERAYEETYQRFGGPHGIFANAGIDMGGKIHELPLETWRSVFETNVTGVFLVCKYGIRQMLRDRITGSIVCTSSPAGFVSLAAGGAAAYSATKAAISALVRCMAIDYGANGIRVNAVVPGATETEMMWANVPEAQIPKVREQLNREIVLGRVASPEEPARAVMWLLSEESSYVTGSHLICDGGILAKGSISV